MKIDLENIKDGKVYTISFDEYQELDTVEKDGKFLFSTNRVVKKIITHADSIRRGNIPEGFKKVKK